MSNTVFVFIQKNKIPSTKNWQKSVEKLGLGIDLKLPSGGLIVDFKGYFPCVWNESEEVGFELYSEPSQDVVDEHGELEEIARGYDFCVSLSWGGSIKDCAAAYMGAAALAKYYDAAVLNEDDDIESIDDLIVGVKELVAEGLLLTKG